MSELKSGDVRYANVRERLYDSIMLLASEKPIDDLSVAEVARHTGISRTTFYNHADSPGDLLIMLMMRELEPVLHELGELIANSQDHDEAEWASTYVAFLSSLSDFQNVFGRGLLAMRYSEMFGRLVGELCSRISGRVKEVELERSREPGDLAVWHYLATQNIVYGLISIFEAWTNADPRPSVEDVVATYLTIASPHQWLKR